MAEQAREKLEQTKVSAHFFLSAETDEGRGAARGLGVPHPDRTAGNGRGYYKVGSVEAAASAAAAAEAAAASQAAGYGDDY